MPVDASIYGAYAQKPKSIQDFDNENIANQQARQSLQQNALNLQLSQQKANEYTEGMGRQMQIRNALAGLGPNATPEARISALEGTYTPEGYTAADALRKSGQELQKTAAITAKDYAAARTSDSEAEKNKFSTQSSRMAYQAQRLVTVQNPQDAVKWYDDAVKMGHITADQAASEKQLIPQTPQDFSKWKSDQMLAGMSSHDQAVTAETAKNNSAKLLQDAKLAADTNATHIKTANISAGASMSNNANTLKKDYVLGGYNPDGTPSADSSARLDQPSIINAAARYNMDGTLPPSLGRGMQGAMNTVAVLKESARQAAERGDTPESQRIAQLANKSSAQALTKLSGQEAIVGAAEKNFTANSNMVTGLTQKVDNTGVPILNKWINAGKRSVLGDPDISALDANIKATVNEYAKIVGGGTGVGATAQGEISKIEGLLSSAQSPAQIENVLNVMRKETANRMQSFKDQKSELTSSMIPAKKPSSVGSTMSGDIHSQADAILKGN